MTNNRALKRAIDFVEDAALEKHPEAMFEYGEIRLKGIQRDKSIQDGVLGIFPSKVT